MECEPDGQKRIKRQRVRVNMVVAGDARQKPEYSSARHRMNYLQRRVLLVTTNLSPLRGGMEKLLSNCAITLSGPYSLTVVDPKDCAARLDDSIEVWQISRGLFSCLLQAPLRVFLLRRHRFDLFFGGSGLVAPLCWLFGKFFRAVTVFYVYGLDVVVPDRVYQNLFAP